MAKKSKKKGSDKKNTAENSELSHEKTSNAQKMLIENFVSLQEVMTNMSSKLNNLTGQISRLLELFEQSAKTFMEKDLKFAGGTDKELVSKLDRLIEQNKIIAQGITLLHEEYSAMPESNIAPMPQPPQFPQQGMNQDNVNNRYQRSLSSKQDAKIPTGQTAGQ
jgi:hypothetical protein